jgi:hypothetical protein
MGSAGLCAAAKAIPAALRAALPWDLPAERLDAMAEEYYGEAVYEDVKSALQDVYRADPIMRELYPERFNVAA